MENYQMRLSHLMESKNTVTLFRGDSSEIAQFHMGELDTAALVGSGVYLTTSHDVAKDYTIKGTNELYRSDEGGAKNPRRFMQELFWNQLHPVMSRTIRAANDTLIYGSIVPTTSHAERKYVHSRTMQLAKPIIASQFRKIYDTEYVAFKATFNNTRLMTTVRNEIVIIRDNDLGHVSRFRIPKPYLGRCLRVDDPCEDWVIEWITQVFQTINPKFDANVSRIDMRYNDPEFGEKHADNLMDWVDKFKKYGARFAWANYNTGGKGENPSIMEILYGTYFGNSLVHSSNLDLWDKLRVAAQVQEHVGLHYAGGRSMGTDGEFTGGSDTKHDVYVLWNQDDANGFRIKTKVVGIPGTDARLFSRFRFTSIMAGWLKTISLYDNETLPVVDDAARLDADIQSWLDSGEMMKKMEQEQ
jgi:hypothetical protein